ncbi:MAG: exodeoxyribonuclease I [Endozoicomonas sp. (ex Botrylloides leachii)]|nr:exodeoxyribonuclease I [Endozoicomonas sp. (ex Botrylloides leachii)]
MKTFYWFDFETTGTNPAMDWPAQFAGIRTDSNLNEIGEPLNIFCQLPADRLPHPEALMITGLDPCEVNKKGLIEPEFIKKIHLELIQSGTCAAGYNSIRFDDEVIRYSLYRNFYDPYAREWKNGNSRWDLIDLVRLTAALRPEGINWPIRDDGHISFKLEELTQANGLDHDHAHDALSDVRATIALAKLIKKRQPKVYDYVFNNRNKHKVKSLLDTFKKEPVVHISGMFGADRGCLAVVMPLSMHPINSNGVIVFDLSVNPEPLLSLSVEAIQQRLFTPTSKLAESVTRIPLKVVHINKCPVIAPLKVLREEDCERLMLDLTVCDKHRQLLLQQPNLSEKIQQVFSAPQESATDDPDLMLYSGGFFSAIDRERMKQVISTPPDQLSKAGGVFTDKRLDKMLFRYRARHYPEHLNAEESEIWRAHCIKQMTRPEQCHFGFRLFMAELNQAKQKIATQDQQQLLNSIETYASDLASSQGVDLTDFQ